MSTLNRCFMSSAAELNTILFEEEEEAFSLGGGGKLESSSTFVAPTGLDTAEPPPSTPLLTDGVFSESLQSSSSPEINKQN